MSKNVTPWILEYLIDVAQQHGANTSAFPVSVKKKSVQIVKFLSYGSEKPDEDTIIWAHISDKKHYIPVRFSKESVAEHRRFSGHRLTIHRTSLITIKKYRLILSRIPNGDNLTACSHLVLDCTEFSSRSSYNEPIWDGPRDVEADVSDMREWVAGLRKGGGDGNMLKERIQNQNGEKHVQILLPDLQRSLSRPRQPEPQLKAQPTCKPRSRGKGKEAEHTFARKRERRWVACSRYPERHSTIPVSERWKEVVRELSIYGEKESSAVDRKAKRNTKRSHPLALESSQPSQSQLYESSARKDPVEESGHESWPSQQATPPPSGSPEPQSPGEQRPVQSRDRSASPLTDWDLSEGVDDEQMHVLSVSQSKLPPSSPPPLSPSPHHPRSSGPTPAQRKRAVSSSSQGQRLNLNAGKHQSSSRPFASSHEMSKANDRQHSMSPPKSSLVSCVITTQTANYLSSPSREYGMNVRRKVSPPPQPQHLPLGEKPLVLVPNSDTSGSQGQTQNQSQEKQMKKHLEVEEGHDSQRSIASIPAPIHVPSRGGNFSQGSIVPETQPQGSETENRGEDEELTADGNGYVREAELSMEVHPGTIDDNHAGAEDENPQDQVDGGQNRQLICPKETDLDHTDFHEDDAQTLEYLRKSTRLCYDPQDWVRPSFMESTRGHGSGMGLQQHNPKAGPSELTREPYRYDPAVLTDSKQRECHDDTSRISLKRKGVELDEQVRVDGPVGKKIRVKHDAVCRDTITTPDPIDREPKLDGYCVGLDDMESSEPWMMTWERLGRILLTTGRARVHNFKSRQS